MPTLAIPVAPIEAAMEPLLRRRPLPLLPVMGKPLVHFQLEAASSLGFDRVLVLSDDRPNATRDEVGGGERWGLDVEVRAVGRGMPIDAQMTRIGPHGADIFILAPGVLLPPADTEGERTPPEQGLMDDHGWVLARWTGDHGTGGTFPPAPGCERCQCWRVDTPEGFFATHMDLLRDAGSAVIPGFEVSPGIIVARGSRFSLGAVIDTPVFVGAYARCSHRANLGPSVAVGDHAFIDDEATLKKAVVLPGTYVGRLLDVDGVILDGQTIVNPETGSAAVIGDDLLLADLDRPVLGARIAGTLSRMAAAILAVLASPLWLLAWLTARSPRRVAIRILSHRVRTTVDGGIERQTMEIHDFNHTRPALRWVGRLGDVLRGDLTLVGNPPLTPAEAETLDPILVQRWLEAPVGLFGHAQEMILAGRGRTELMEIAAAAAYHTGTRSTRTDLGRLIRGLVLVLMPRSWVRHTTARRPTIEVGAEA
jgi:hypothetical protein